MQKKRGQLTIFILIAIIIVFIILGYLFLFKSNIEEYPSNINTLKEEIVNCHQDLSERSIDYIGYNGGFYQDFNKYYYVKGEVNFPSLEEISDELKKAIDENINICYITNPSIDIEYKNPSTKISFKKDSIIVETNLEIIFKDDENKSYIINLINYPATIKSRFLGMYKLSEFFVDSITNSEEEWIRAGELDELAKENGLYLRIEDHRDITDLKDRKEYNNLQLITIYSEDIEDYPLAYRFYISYNYFDLGIPENLGGEDEN
jgi:hypothetical protein